MSHDPEGWGSRVFDFSFGLLLAAMALYGAVQVVRAIWIPLCIGIFVILVVALFIWFFIIRARRF